MLKRGGAEKSKSQVRCKGTTKEECKRIAREQCIITTPNNFSNISKRLFRSIGEGKEGEREGKKQKDHAVR